MTAPSSRHEVPPVAPPGSSRSSSAQPDSVPGSSLLAQSWRERIFQHAFARTFVYPIVFEDCENDARHLGIDQHSTLLSIAGAGCGIAGHLSRHPRRIDAVDTNLHHLALTGLKCAAATRVSSYSDFYDLFGRGWQPYPELTVPPLAASLPSWMQRYWRRHARLFASSIYKKGLVSYWLAELRRRIGIGPDWLSQMQYKTEAERVAATEQHLVAGMKGLVAAAVRSPALLLAQGINYVQRERMYVSWGTRDVVEIFCDVMRQYALADVPRNWITWFSLAGRFNHDLPDAVPPYLRRESHARSLAAPTQVRYHNRSIFAVLGESAPRTYSHFVLSDIMDWMPRDAQLHLLSEVRRTAKPDAMVVYRTVELASLVERVGLADKLLLLEPLSSQASAVDRAKNLRRINFYRAI